MSVVRLGATGDQNDFRYFVGPDGQWDLSRANLDRLRNTVRRFGENKLKVIITLSHIPGRFWQQGQKDLRLFKGYNYQEQFYKAWKTIASFLAQEDNVVGYDLLNEPLLPEEVGLDTSAIDYSVLTLQIEGTPSDINEFYRKAIFAIREVDKKTPIILEATGTGDFSSIAILKPSQDPYVFYSFHYYEPYAYYKGKAAQGRLVYPGPIIIDGPLWNKQAHRTNFAKVDNWRKSNQIDCSHLYVGEFGVWKDAIGAQTYLRDITDLFEEFGWSWTYYAFREDAFPHVDLELEGELKQRTETPLFKIVRSKFQ